MTPTRFPLAWPVGWKRVMPGLRRSGQFRSNGRPITLYAAAQRVVEELNRLDGIRDDDVILSTNVRVRLDGLPRSGEPAPEDPGAAVYWQPPVGPMRCMAIDRYTSVEDNLAAIAATLEAMRAIERHGGAAILDRAFTGFAALPAPIVAGMKRDWREVLGVKPDATPTEAEIQQLYRHQASLHHPDRAGDDLDRLARERRMAEINSARDEALGELQRRAA